MTQPAAPDGALDLHANTEFNWWHFFVHIFVKSIHFCQKNHLKMAVFFAFFVLLFVVLNG